MKARAEFVLKKFFLSLSLDSCAGRGHLKKRGNTKRRRPLTITASTFGNVMTDFKSTIVRVEDLSPMPTSAFVQLFTSFADVGFSAPSAKDDVNNIGGLTCHLGFIAKTSPFSITIESVSRM